MYRFRRLGEARSAALEAGFRGAMYPWQSGSDGREETQVSHLNPLSNRWEPDVSHLQRHVNSAIFYNIWQYYQATENIHFLRDYGAEMMLQIARFWASAAHFNPDRERWEIHGMMGPDEFHTGLPGADAPGLPNNAYTNVMAAWVFETAQRLLDMLPASRREALREKVGLTDDELSAWRDMSRAMFVPFHGDGIISQFEGYEELEELDWELYRAEHGNVQRLDRILRAEGDDPNRYKITKQADVLMLFYLFTERELRQLFERLGYPYDADTARKNVEYYTARTSNGSTLSFVANAAALAPIDEERSWGSFRLALESDLKDVQGGTTQEGIHLAVMAGTLDLVQSAFVGHERGDGGALRFEPRLLDRIDGVSFRMQFRGAYLRVTIEERSLEIVAEAEGFRSPSRSAWGDAVSRARAGEHCAFELERPSTLSEP